MDLVRNTGDLIRWTFQVLRQLAHVSPAITYTVIIYSVIARTTRMLAFLLPIKIILLAGSDGVPRYFRAFLAPEHKDEGILALSVAAFVCYGLTLLLEARSKRLSEAGSDRLLAASAVMSLVNNQRVAAQGYYARFTQVAASVLFASIGLLVLLLLDPVLAAYLAGLMVCLYLFSAWALQGITPLKRTTLSDVITDDLANYLGILSSLIFLSSFLVILYPFVAGTNGNILVAIICVVLLRQMLSALTGCIRDAVALTRQTPLINTLVFPDHQLQVTEAKDQRTLRDLFGREEREARIAEELADQIKPGETLKVEWCDPTISGTVEFSIVMESDGAPARHFRQRVFPPRLTRMLENEDLLFRHLDRASIWAPPLVRRFSHGEYACIVCEAGTGTLPDTTEWRKLPGVFLADLWCVEPPPDLVRIYRSSHKLLHERLTDEFVARMDIAIDSDEAQRTFEQLRAALPAVREQIAALPLVFVNPGFVREQVVARSEGGFYALAWGQWSLEPLGGNVLQMPTARKELEILVDRVRQSRPGRLPPAVGAAHLLMARNCARLERGVLRGARKAGRELATAILANLDSFESQLPQAEKDHRLLGSA